MAPPIPLRLLRQRPPSARSTPVYSSRRCRILDEDSKPVRRTLIEVWNCNTYGRYPHADDTGNGNPQAKLDPNFYGFDANIGLMMNKSKSGMTPFPNGPVQLYKMITADKIRVDGNNAGKKEGYLYFSLRRASQLLARYRALWTPSEAPQTHQLVGEPFFGPDALGSAEILSADYFSEGEAVKNATGLPFRTPDGMDVNLRAMPPAQ